MTARLDEAPPDTARRQLLVLARRQVGLPNSTVEDELPLLSAITDPAARSDAFTALCRAVRDRQPDAMTRALDLLTGGASC